MTIDVEPLRALEDFQACERLEKRLLGEHAGASVVGVAALRAAAESGGLLLGAREDDGESGELVGAVVDLATTWERFPALFSLVFGVAADHRTQGIGLLLRQTERRFALERGIEVIRTWVDPLRSCECHLLWNRIGAIGTGYIRNAYGELADRVNLGLATDRVCTEWWLRSPRTLALLERGLPAAHLRAGLHEMDVATRTTVGPSGRRVLADAKADTNAASVLIEIPVDIDLLRDEDPAEARRWRLGTREVFERLAASGYLFAGLVHEGGRSFQWLVRADRSEALGRG
jgi:predicted GNAT superfamily acetyltransferase